MFKIIKLLLTTTIISLVFIACSSKTKIEKKEAKQEITNESHKSLNLLYKNFPETKEMIKNAYGYATFSNLGVELGIISTEQGKGLAHSNKTGKSTYMKMFSGGVGLGVGIKDFRAIFIFENQKVYDEFVEHGWEANAQAEATAKYEKDGKAYNAAQTVQRGVILYKLTKNGLALQTTIQGTRFWKDSDLN